MRPMRLLSCILVLLLVSQTSAAADRKKEIATWLHALGDVQPKVRADAKRELMGISNDELPLLKQVITAALPLKPAEAEPLQEIVTYIRTRHLMLQHPRAAAGFLGVSLASMSIEEADDDDRISPIGVPVVERLPGFIAYRYLEPGDVVLAIGEPRRMRPTTTQNELRMAVQSLPPGQPITLRVLRGKTFMLITFTLDSAINATADAVRQFSEDAANEAERYWNDQFRPLIEPDPV
jgi:hypothetical protein